MLFFRAFEADRVVDVRCNYPGPMKRRPETRLDVIGISTIIWEESGEDAP